MLDRTKVGGRLTHGTLGAASNRTLGTGCAGGARIVQCAHAVARLVFCEIIPRKEVPRAKPFAQWCSPQIEKIAPGSCSIETLQLFLACKNTWGWIGIEKTTDIVASKFLQLAYDFRPAVASS